MNCWNQKICVTCFIVVVWNLNLNNSEIGLQIEIQLTWVRCSCTQRACWTHLLVCVYVYAFLNILYVLMMFSANKSFSFYFPIWMPLISFFSVVSFFFISFLALFPLFLFIYFSYLSVQKLQYNFEQERWELTTLPCSQS